MLLQTLKSLGILLMGKSKGVATAILIVGVFAVCIAAGWISAKYLGPDNAMEEDLEEIAEGEAEEITHQPKGSLKKEVDSLFPHK